MRIWVGLAVFLAGAAFAWLLGKWGAAAPRLGEGAELAVTSSELTQQMQSLQQAQESLSKQVSALQALHALPVAELPGIPQSRGDESMEDTPIELAPSDGLPIERNTDQRQVAQEAQVERLQQAGLTTEEFDFLRQRAEQTFLDGFEQDWAARRERFLADPPPPNGRDLMREELGDSAYDRYLYASGYPNRVVVGNVVAGSAAERAGLQQGDVLLSYNSERLFSFEDLRTASYRGEMGESVLLEVQRGDGQRVQIAMPRGPMGVSGGRSLSLPPEG